MLEDNLYSPCGRELAPAFKVFGSDLVVPVLFIERLSPNDVLGILPDNVDRLLFEFG